MCMKKRIATMNAILVKINANLPFQEDTSMTILEYVLKLERDSIDLYEKYWALDYKKGTKEC